MTSIAHSVLPGAVPAVGGSQASDPAAFERRLLRPAGSKAVRLGLGVAIAAVMAGDVYAVLRSPVSEGRGAGAGPASVSLNETSPASPVTAASGPAATNPFAAAGYDATVGTFSVPAATAAGRGLAPAASSVVPATAAPAPTTAPTITLPTAPATQMPTSSFTPAWNQETPQGDPSTSTPTPPPSLLAPVVDPVIATVHEVPVVGPEVAPVVQQVVDAVPTEELAPVVTAVPLPTLGLRSR